MKSRFRTLICCVALALSAPAALADNYVYILTGQSNSLGAVKGTPATAEQLERYASQAQLWSGNMERDSGKPFDANPSWQTVAPQLPGYNGSLCMGPEYGFAHMMQRRNWHSSGSKKLFIIKASLDGGGNSFWLPGKPAWLTLTKTVKEGLAALSGKTHVQALLYLQGESNKGEEITQAPSRFTDLKSRLQKEVKKGLKYAVAGECATWGGRDEKDAKGNTTAELMHALARKKKDIGWVRTRDLTKITSGDNMGVHYDGKSQITIGARYAYAVAVLEKLPLGSVRGDDPAAALDSPAAWWGGKLPTAADTATWDISAARTEDKLAKPLSVAGLVVEDPPSGSVTISAAKPAATLQVGAVGISLQEGDLAVDCELATTADQTWELAPGRTLKIARLIGKGVITLHAPESATLAFATAPSHDWILPADTTPPGVTIDNAPAKFEKHGKTFKIKVRSTNDEVRTGIERASRDLNGSKAGEHFFLYSAR